MRSVHVDPSQQVARVDGGATLGRLDRETQVFGLATTAGTVTHTGVGGLTLGGGVGHLAPKYGLACDNLISVDVVTADGGFLKASASENEDSFGVCAAVAGILVSQRLSNFDSMRSVPRCSTVRRPTRLKMRQRRFGSFGISRSERRMK